MQKDFSFTFDEKEHDAIIIAKDTTRKPSFVFVHGAGAGTKERVFTFSDYLVEQNLSLLAFDQSGAGRDAANLQKTSLAERTKESKHVIETFADTDNLTVCGSSMGGEIAVRMLDFFPIKNLVLFCPGIYDASAFTIPFDQGFTDVIRRPNSWKNSHAVSLLQSFTGNLLVVIGSGDQVIPPGVIKSIDAAAINTKRKEILRIPDCPHGYQSWLAEHSDWSLIVAKKVLAFSV